MMNCQCQLGVSSFGVLLALVVFFDIILYSGGSTVFSDSEVPSSAAEDIREYCMSTEAFQASCRRNEIIMMTSAVYGRMRIGRCLVSEGQGLLSALGNNPNFFGCFVDVLPLMDKKCSGLNQCEVTGTLDQDFKKLRPCHEALKLYLEASYRCISVIEEDRTCTVSVTSSAQHLMTSHSSSTELSCGSRHQPWKLEAPAGQQINVSLLDFGGAANQLQRDCLLYGYIIDGEANKNVSMCATNKRIDKQSFLLQSKSSALQIVFGDIYLNSNSSQRSQTILVRVEAVGCSYFVPPEDMWLRRRNQEAVVGCYSSRQTWYLNCINNQWLGVIGNCTRESAVNAAEIADIPPTAKNHILMAVSIAVIGVIICVVIVVCGFVCMKRYTSMMKQAGHNNDVKRMNNGWQPDACLSYPCSKTLLQHNRQLI